MINLLKPIGYFMYHPTLKLKIIVHSAHTAHFCFSFGGGGVDPRKHSDYFPEMENVYCAVRAGPLNKPHRFARKWLNAVIIHY